MLDPARARAASGRVHPRSAGPCEHGHGTAAPAAPTATNGSPVGPTATASSAEASQRGAARFRRCRDTRDDHDERPAGPAAPGLRRWRATRAAAVSAVGQSVGHARPGHPAGRPGPGRAAVDAERKRREAEQAARQTPDQGRCRRTRRPRARRCRRHLGGVTTDQCEDPGTPWSTCQKVLDVSESSPIGRTTHEPFEVSTALASGDARRRGARRAGAAPSAKRPRQAPRGTRAAASATRRQRGHPHEWRTWSIRLVSSEENDDAKIWVGPGHR